MRYLNNKLQKRCEAENGSTLVFWRLPSDLRETENTLGMLKSQIIVSFMIIAEIVGILKQ